jgi:1-acyl-sn-glycerol-3-phosphate acyltransferase
MMVLRQVARLALRLLGWTLVDLPQRPARAVVIGYPHTSNWDFPVAMLALAALPLDARWVAKDTLCRWPFGFLMRALGGIPVNRREHTGFVRRAAAEFRRRENFHLIVAVEGTRRRQEGWKSGFYRIALAAGVPLIIGVINYARREIGLGSSIDLTGDENADMSRIAGFYSGHQGYRPENASPIRLL